MRTHVKFTCVNEIETMYERPRVNMKVERGPTFAFTRDLPYIVFFLFTRIKIYVRTQVKITRQWKSTFSEYATKTGTTNTSGIPKNKAKFFTPE